MHVCQVRCGASCAGEAGEGDRAGRDSADDGGAASGRQNLQRVLPTRRPLPAGGEFWLTAWTYEQENKVFKQIEQETFHLEARSVAQERLFSSSAGQITAFKHTR